MPQRIGERGRDESDFLTSGEIHYSRVPIRWRSQAGLRRATIINCHGLLITIGARDNRNRGKSLHNRARNVATRIRRTIEDSRSTTASSNDDLLRSMHRGLRRSGLHEIGKVRSRGRS